MRHIEDSFAGQKNFRLHYQGWLPDNEPRAVLLVVHGLAEHSGRYRNIADYFVPRGYAVYGLDHQGHGESKGKRGYIERFSHFVDDLATFLRLIHRKHPATRVFLVGHSVGGTIATTYAIRHQNDIDGLILSGATLKPGASISAGVIIVARILSLFLPKMGLEAIDASAISQNKAVVDAYINDPLVYRGKISARLGGELLKAMQTLSSQMPEIHLPILIMYGTADRLSEPSGSQMLYERVSSKDKTLIPYEGFHHEIFNEPERELVFADMEAWLAARM
ncbi:MAG: lysophospholipase [Chloroflexi bacterium]|nr:lysophospholipase [Chloroflexota bacterium]